MNPRPLRALLLAGYATSFASAFAQTAPTTPSGTEQGGEAIKLSVFEVSSARDFGYRAATALSATGTGMDIKDTPVSINVVTREFIDDLGTSNIKDALQYVAGVNTSARNANTVVVRGFNPGTRSEFGTTGLPIGGGEFVERVEIMKGPNAIFFGRVAPGGVINQISKQPKFDRSSVVDFQYGSYDYKKASIDLTGPISDKLAYRLVGYALDKGDGYEDFTGERGKGLKADLLYQPFPQTNIRLQASAETQTVRRIHSPPRTSSEYLRICAPNGRYDPTITFNGIPCSQMPHVWAMNQNARLRSLGQLNAYFIDRYFFDVHPRGRRAHYDGPDARKHAERAGIYAGFDHRFNEVFALKVDYSRNESEGENLESSWFPRPDGMVVGQQPAWNGSLRAPSWGAEAELVAEFKLGPTSHRFLVGAEHSEGESQNWSQTLPAVTFDFSGGAVYRIASQVPLVRTSNTILAWSRTQGTYGVGVSRFFDERLVLLYGARRTRVTQGINGAATPAGQVVTPFRKSGGRILTDDTFQGGAVFKVTDNISVFAGYGETYEPQTTVSFDGSRLDPVSGEGWEAGVKSEFNEGRLATTLSVFRNERIGIANRDFGREITTGTQPWFIPGGSEATEGAELEIFYSPIRNYQAVLSYAHFWTAETIENKENPNLVGRGLQFTPKDTISLWNRYTFTSGKLRNVTVGGGIRHNGRHEALANLDWFKIINPSWTRVDLMAAYETKLFGRKTYLQLNIENVFDKYYIDGEYTAARPLTVMFRTKLTF
ncbi:MAG TPA: TonB-dependent receptor [Opitutaceae bacterium]|nr:TonB-dependent receptor [Opitutaceae bacterium]